MKSIIAAASISVKRRRKGAVKLKRTRGRKRNEKNR
jgi:hypothetical protein